MEKVKMQANSRVLKTLVAVSLLVMSFGTLLSSYLQQIYSETISFFVRDGWCQVGAQGFGIHCFGDFYAPMTVASSANPWTNDLNLAYTPFNFFYFKILNSGFITNLGTHVSIMINISLTLLALSLPGIYILRKQHEFSAVSGKWVLLISLTSAPSLMVIDRGSSSFLLFPAVFFFFLGIQRQNLTMVSYSLITMGLWKPQTLILSIGILLFFGMKPFLISLLKFILIFMASFLLYPIGILRNFTDYIQNSKDYQNYVPIPTPGNYSFVNFIGFVKGILGWAFNGFGSIDEAFRPPLDREFVAIFCTSYAAFVLLIFYLARHAISKFQFIISSSVFMLTIAGTTFGYYLTLMLIPLFLVSNNDVANEFKVRGNRRTWNLYLLFLFLSVPAWPINWGNLPVNVGDSWSTLGVHWTFVHGIVSLLVLLSLYELFLLSLSTFKNKKVIT
jgi:hypothetical protein